MTQTITLDPEERLIRPASMSDERKSAQPAFADLPLAKKLNLDEEIKFVNDMLSRYVANDDKIVGTFQEIKSRVNARQQETRLFLGVIGEFSSGKSTLVNALIREQLLRTDILQGTTAAATLLSYGEKLDVQVRRKKGHIFKRAFKALSGIFTIFSTPPLPPTRDDLLEMIHQATSDEEFAKDIVQVDVTIPSTTLRDGLVIVDTPGANASNHRHAQVTAAALRDVCDAAIVVVPAEAAGSESLFNFLQTHAAEVLYRCVFVVTKIDLIRREKERERVLQNLRTRISRQLQIANPRVLPCAPQFVIESLNPQRNGEDTFSPEEIRDWVSHFVEMEKELDKVLRLKRLQAQVDDIAKLAMQLLNRLKALLNERLDGYRQRHEALAKAVIPSIETYIDQRINAHVKQCDEEIESLASQSGRKFESMFTSIVSEMSSAIGGADSRKTLREAVETKIPKIYSSGQRRLQRHLQRIMDDIAKAGKGELRRFHDEFQQHFRSLATLDGKLDVEKVDAHAVARGFSASGQAANLAIANELKSLDQQQTMGQVGLTASGAVIGTFILPGIGTLIGGLVGNVFSMMFGPSLDELKNECWSRLQPEVMSGIRSYALAADEGIETAQRSTLSELGTAIASYLPRYQDLVERMNARDADEKRQLEVFQNQIQGDLQQIDGRRQNLEELRLQLRDL